jgi:branched-chain amino acid transport system substrate-binding protein
MKRRIINLASAMAVFSFAMVSPVSGHAEETVKIGAPYELSGKFVSFGSQGQRGIEMALDAFGNTVAGRKVEFLLKDVQSTNQGTVTAMTELLQKDNVDFVIGPVASGLVSAAVPVWRQKKPLWIVTGSSATSFEEAIAGEDMIFHTYPYAYHYHETTANALAARIGKGKKVAIIYSDGSYGRSQFPFAKDAYTQAGFEVVATELVRENATDMSPALQKIRLSKPDVLVGIVQTTDAIVLAKQIYTAKMSIPYLVGTAYPQLKEWADAVGEAGNGWIAANSYILGVNTSADPNYPKLFPSSKDWEAAFRKRYNRDPEFMDVTVYTSAVMLLLAIDRAGSVDKQKVAKELHDLNVKTMLGDGKFVKTRGGGLNQAFGEMLVFQRQGNDFAILAPASVADGRPLIANKQ